LTDDEFKQRLRDFGGTPALILDDDQLMARALPILRADFVLIERYLAEPQARVSCPITVFAGIADPGTPPATIAAWQPRTTAAYRVVTVDAGHFFLESHRAQLISEIARDLSLSEAR
jgi:medium-chain acyl-[acyl-carrier-protein] hydrolase